MTDYDHIRQEIRIPAQLWINAQTYLEGLGVGADLEADDGWVTVEVTDEDELAIHYHREGESQATTSLYLSRAGAVSLVALLQFASGRKFQLPA